MKALNHKILITLTAATLALVACEDVIDPTLEEAEPLLVVDAWLNTQPGAQVIRLTQTQPYFDNSTPLGVRGASVLVTNTTDGRVLQFEEVTTEPGTYQWVPAAPGERVGQTGDLFNLALSVGNEQYTSVTRLGRVPQIDSIIFIYEAARGFFPENYQAEFFATDPAGAGDTYWIKAYKNDTLLLKPGEINIAFDAGFTAGGNFDGVTFITPIRRGINPFDFDDDGNFLSPYLPGDSVYVEIHSISVAAFNFLNEAILQIDRPGGFSELFASPIANVSTNINNVNPNGTKAVGFFNVAAVSGAGKRLIVE
ncbi:MAG: DUF4249 domain-containing protein [Bacteroidota bacterium]